MSAHLIPNNAFLNFKPRKLGESSNNTHYGQEQHDFNDNIQEDNSGFNSINNHNPMTTISPNIHQINNQNFQQNNSVLSQNNNLNNSNGLISNKINIIGSIDT